MASDTPPRLDAEALRHWRGKLNRYRNDGSCERELLDALAQPAEGGSGLRTGAHAALEENALTAAALAIADLYRGEGGWCGLEAAREQARVTLVAYQRAAGARQEWRPIEEAPKDGTHVLLAFGQDTVAEGWWDDGFDLEPHPWKFVDTGGPAPPNGRPSLGFINGSRDERYGPSHWMPLPPPPLGRTKP